MATTVDYFQRKLDDKRRLTIPSELRDEFASGVVTTRGFQKYLHLYPKSVWDELVEPKLQGTILDEQVADLNVRFRMGKTDGSIDDKQGRITIEQHLLDYAGIDKEIVAVRVGKYWRLMTPESTWRPLWPSTLFNNPAITDSIHYKMKVTPMATPALENGGQLSGNQQVADRHHSKNYCTFLKTPPKTPPHT